MKLFKALGLTGYQRDNHIVGIMFILSILLPHTGALYLVNPLLLLYLIKKYSWRYKPSNIQIALGITIIISIVWSTFSGIDISSKSLIRSFYILLILVFFPFCGNVRIPSFYIYFVVCCILLSQICYIYNITYIINLINRLYPYEGDLVSESVDYLVTHAHDAGGSLSRLQVMRFGGLFHNSNQCMKYISLCTIAFILENHKKDLKYFLPFLIVVFLSAFLAGSRTGFMVIALSLVIAYSMRSGHGNLRRNVSIMICFGVLYILSNFLSDDFRLLKLSEGFEEKGSISLKYANLSYYLNVMDTVRAFLFGNASLENIKNLYNTPFSQFDSEWGNAIYFYGFTFITLYGFFLMNNVLKLKGIYIVSALMLIWIVSSTILFSFRTSFAFFLLLSKYVSASR